MNNAPLHEMAAHDDPLTSPGATPAEPRAMLPADELLLREIHHRSSNDLQLVVSLLSLQAQRAASSEARDALKDATERVSILARARSTLHHPGQHSLEEALRQVCEALQSQAEPRGILISLDVDKSPRAFPAAKIMNVALTVNELITNAIKHAFKEDRTGFVRVSLRQQDDDQVIVIVDDDGLPFPEIADFNARGKGLGLNIAKRLIAAIGGTLIVPKDGSKVFELQIRSS